MSDKKQFEQWLTAKSSITSGKVSSYVNGLRDVDLIAQFYCPKFKLMTVYDMPSETVKSLHAFVNGEKLKEAHSAGSSELNSVPGLPVSYWRDGFCSRALLELVDFKQSQEFNADDGESLDDADVVDEAVLMFARHRLDVVWVKLLKRDGYEGLHARYEGMNPDVLRKMSAAEFDKWVDDELWAARTFFCGQNIKKLSDADKTAFCGFIAATKQNFRLLSNYLGKDAELPNGVGPVVLTELLMKFHPLDYCNYNVLMLQGLKVLGLVESEKMPSSLSVAEYQKLMGFAADILERLTEAKVPRMFDEDEKCKPDFITVNEFLWWCKAHQDLIKEEVMKTEFKSVTEKRKELKGEKKLSDVMKDELLARLAAALRTKPFAILAGHSGTGKSQMVRRLAYMTCADEGLMAEAKTRNAPGNYCMIQVRPNWHDSTDLLGYYSEIGGKYRTTDFVRFVMKAYAYPDIPFFVCLDEMNLAPVEQYFAEYLSAIESASDRSGKFLTDALVPKDYAADEVADTEACRFTESKAWYEEHGLTIPKNLFVVGTVNMDDTTCQFSRKVLDRAMTIMMDKVSFEDMMDKNKSAEPSEKDLLESTDVAKFLEGKLRADPLTTHQVALLNSLEGVLGKTPFAVAYRFANEYALYEASLAALTGKSDDEELAKEAMDHCVLMKVLPRIHGTDIEVKRIFRGKDDGAEKGLESILDKESTLSGKKMEEILARNTTYLSFWP